MKTKKSKYKFLISISIVLVLLVGVVTGGFFALDKLVVPKYFGKYGINSMQELVSMVKTMHAIPKESEFIINPHTKNDELTAKNKLIEVGFPKLSSGEIDYSEVIKEDFFLITDPSFAEDYLELSDKEVAAIMDSILDSGALIPELKELSYLDTLSMTITEVKITPIGAKKTITVENSDNKIITKNNYSSAEISITIKVNLEDAINQMSKNLDVPIFLLNMILPSNMYITSSFTTSINEENQWTYSNSKLTLNAKTEKQSEVVLNLLISFIYSKDENMSIEKLSEKIADLVKLSFEIIGNINFADDIKSGTTNNNGIRVLLTKQDSE